MSQHNSALPSIDVTDDPLALIRKRELAKLLGVHQWTVDNWRKRKRLPPPIVLSPCIVAWRRADIARWLEERAPHPASTRDPRAQAQAQAQARKQGGVR